MMLPTAAPRGPRRPTAAVWRDDDPVAPREWRASEKDRKGEAAGR